MDEQILAYSYTALLLRNKKNWTIYEFNNIDELQDNSDESKKPGQKNHILCDQIYVKFREYLGI